MEAHLKSNINLVKPKVLEDEPIFDSYDLDTTAQESRKSFTWTLRPSIVNKDFENMTIIRYLHRGSTEIYLVVSRTLKKKFVMKVFKYYNDDPSILYLNESRFVVLQHPNIIKFEHYENKREIKSEDNDIKCSYIITEYASAGDFYDIMVNNRLNFDEKLARTFFQQLIKGVEFIHDAGIAHLDIKLENIVLGDDYQLKIIDFGHGWIDGDPHVRTRGTKFYAAPELEQKKCEDPMAADMFSCGVLLFLLVSRGLPPQYKFPNVKHKDMYELLQENSSEFWTACVVNNSAMKSVSSDFKDVIESCLKKDPKERVNVKDIQKMAWLKGDVYPKNELKGILESYRIYNS